MLGRMPAVPETEDPLADLAAFATAHRDLLLAHPWAVPGLIAHPLPGPNALPIGEQALRILHRLGVDGDRAVATFSGIIALNYGWVSFAIARRASEAAPSMRRIESGPAADFPLHARRRRGHGALRQRGPLRHRRDRAPRRARRADGRLSLELGEQRSQLREGARAMRVGVLLDRRTTPRPSARSRPAARRG